MAKIMLNGVNYGSSILENSDLLILKGDSYNRIVSSDKNSSGCVPLQICTDLIELKGDTGRGTLQSEGDIHMKGESAEISFDKDGNIPAQTKITKSKIYVSELHPYLITGAYGISTTLFSVSGVCASNLSPMYDNSYTLGNSSSKWKQLFANTSVISTSDRNVKKDIKDLDDKWVDFFMLLQPKSYLFKDGESGRTHVGFISQDVEEALEACGMSPLDFAGFCKDQKIDRITEVEKITRPANTETGESEWIENKEIIKENPVFDKDGNPVYIYSLRYEEFIALNTMMIQKLYTKNKDFEERLSKLEQVLIND